ncbi:Lsr2 family protein [Streptomyces sp. SID3343]|uniref:Lsr2 family DNA-binding protein n=1 Tax=Streptomyces sp. SID3343 TaxID=2690260 RepID=UPI001369F273|nr:Lsr2 family protein [Streptomyces sp. SID3343]MYW06043.1 hypothetical protein [Streptomyces sp. SID3343]
MIEIVPEPVIDTTDPESIDAHDDVLDVDALLAWGAAHPTATIRTLAERTAQGLARLAEHRARARAVDAAQARLIEAQLLLARAEAGLRAAKNGTGSAAALTGVPTVDPGPAQRREEGRRARAWAASTGLECPARGIVPKHVLDAYRRRANGGNEA